MFKIEIKSNDVLTNYAEFATETEAQTWLSIESANGSFGKIQREVREISEGILENNEDISLSMSVREETDLMGNVVKIHTLSAEFTSEITDITAQVLAQKESAEALVYLASTDFLILRESEGAKLCPPEIKALRAAARLKVL